MSTDLLARIEGDLCKIGEEIWRVDGADDVVDKVFARLLSLKAQLEVQKTLQATANLLRRIPSDKALPKQQATKVKYLVRFAFRKNSRQWLHEQDKKGDRHQKLRRLDCDALKLCGLSYTTEEIVKLGDAEFEILEKRTEEFIHHRHLSCYLYRNDVDKAVDSKLEDPEDEGSFVKFIQSHTARRHSTHKRKYDAITLPHEAVPGGSDHCTPLQSSPIDITAHETPGEAYERYPRNRSPRTPTQRWASAPNDHPSQCHSTTDHQDDCLQPSPATAFASTDIILQSSDDNRADPVSGIAAGQDYFRFEKHTLQRVVFKQPARILGGIWFGSPPGLQPFVSLRLSRALGDIINPSGQEVLALNPPPGIRTFTGVYLINLDCFRQLIRKEGFGMIFWNKYGEDAFVTMQVIDEELIADFIRVSQVAIGVLPMLEGVSTCVSA